MQIDKTYKLEKIVSKEANRAQLNDVLVVEKEEIAVASNGKAIAFVPVIFEEEGNDRFVNGVRMLPAKVITEGRKASKQLSNTLIELNGGAKLHDGTEIQTEDSLTYPPSWRQYFSTEHEYTEGYSVTLDPKLLHSLAEAMGSGDGVTLHFKEKEGCLDYLAPIRVTTSKSEANGVLMPKRK